MLYSRFIHGLASFFRLLRVGLSAPGNCHHSLHPTPSGHLLALYYSHWWLARRPCLHRRRGHSGCRFAAHVVPGIPPSQTHPRTRIAILDNPSAGNYEELGLLHLDDGNFSRARACYYKAISARTDSPDPFYRRGIAEVELEDFSAAVPDLERAVAADPKYDFYRAPALLAHAYAN